MITGRKMFLYDVKKGKKRMIEIKLGAEAVIYSFNYK
jgi:hypothetical protein